MIYFLINEHFYMRILTIFPFRLMFIPDPKEWTTEQAHSWLRSTIQQFKLPPIPNMEKIFPEDGQELSQLSEDEFIERCPQVRFH